MELSPYPITAGAKVLYVVQAEDPSYSVCERPVLEVFSDTIHSVPKKGLTFRFSDKVLHDIAYFANKMCDYDDKERLTVILLSMCDSCAEKFKAWSDESRWTAGGVSKNKLATYASTAEQYKNRDVLVRIYDGQAVTTTSVWRIASVPGLLEQPLPAAPEPVVFGSWVLCSATLPAEGQNVLVVSVHGKQCTMYRERGVWVHPNGTSSKWQPTHWADLPASPK